MWRPYILIRDLMAVSGKSISFIHIYTQFFMYCLSRFLSGLQGSKLFVCGGKGSDFFSFLGCFWAYNCYVVSDIVS